MTSTLRIPNAIDMHCHYGPDTVGASPDATTGHGVTALQAAREAADSGHAALVLKSHSFASPALAAALTEAVDGLTVFGGICTDMLSGGLNVAAVDAALSMGAKIVWLPTVHSHQDVSTTNRINFRGPGLRVADDEGAPLPVVREIFDLVRERGAILATGHVSAAEHYAVVKEFAGKGNVVVTHAGEHLAGPHLTTEQVLELADLGATIELTALACDDVFGITGTPPADMARMIETVGPQRCVLSTDYGWSTEVKRPAAGLGEFLERLWECGVSEADLTTMASQNPARLLDVAV